MMAPDYCLCDQVVTLYHLEAGRILRQVIQGCYLQWQQKRNMDVFGEQMQTSFLLVMPGDEQRVFVGDRVMKGIGPEITAQQWAGFLPAAVPGLGEVNYVVPYFWEGKLCHVEAGRK